MFRIEQQSSPMSKTSKSTNKGLDRVITTTHCIKVRCCYQLFYVTELEAFTNYDLENIITPVDVDHFEELLLESEYDAEETSFLVNGFRHGFDIEYNGPAKCQSKSENIPFTVGNAKDMGKDHERGPKWKICWSL